MTDIGAALGNNGVGVGVGVAFVVVLIACCVCWGVVYKRKAPTFAYNALLRGIALARQALTRAIAKARVAKH